MRSLLSAAGWSGVLAGLSFLACATGCGDPEAGPPPSSTVEILDVQGPAPVIAGSRLRVEGVGLDTLAEPLRLEVESATAIESLAEVEGEDDSGRWFEVSESLVDVFGPGTHIVELFVSDGTDRTPPFPFDLTLAREVPVALDRVPEGDVHRNEPAVLHGDGILGPGEGAVWARFDGMFRTREGDMRNVDVRLPVRQAERFSRDRGIVLLTTAIGGFEPGTFSGSVTLEVEGPRSPTRSTSVSTELRFLEPALFTVEPLEASLEQIVTVRGAGFLGGPDAPDEATVIRLDGKFAPAGQDAHDFGGELVLRYVSGSEMRGVLAAKRDGNRLVSSLFGAAQGVFTGDATPVVISGTADVPGTSVPFRFELGPVRQVVYLRFLPGFYDSLARFGLAAAAGEIEDRVRARIEGIYDGWNVDVRLERPTDFSANGYATLEVGGPDPNGIGLFGYDNTPGKDIGNVRLHDAIGGENAETTEMGYPGYGGVFVESFLAWSSHPGLPGGAAGSGPDPDPLFDEIFDPVRADAATLAEVRGESGRVEVVQRALDALASIIGETSAHELGHSLGLAAPYGSPNAFHNGTDEDGCLMDSGGARPFGERSAQPGFPETRLCHDAPTYLDEILGGTD